MLSQLNHWMPIAGTVLDALLLLRILQLRLQRTYVLITLTALLTVFFDGVALWLGLDSRENLYVVLYSRFLFLFLFPAAAYDVWEEAKPQIEPLRRFAGIRMVGSLTLACFFGLIIVLVAGSEESQEALLATFAVIVWASAATSSLAFLWSVARLARAQSIVLAPNTSVWLMYFKLLMVGEVVLCCLLIGGSSINHGVLDGLTLAIEFYEMLITGVCVWRLRGVPRDLPSAPEKASS